MEREYDAAGRVTQLTAPFGYFLAYDYLTTGELAHVRGNDEVASLSFAYDQQGRRTYLTRGNGAVTSYGYYPSGLPSHLGHHIPRPGQPPYEPFSYFEPNSAGQIINVVRNNNDYALNQANGSQATPVNGLNQLTQVNAAPTAHDARGNMTGDGLGRGYAYDSDNRLVAASGGVALRYDPLGRLYEVSGPAGARRFTYDGDRLVEATNPGGSTDAYVHGPGADEPLMQIDGGGVSYLHADERGSVTTLSGAGGGVTALNRYDEYGAVQGGLSGRFGFTGQAFVPEIGLHYYKARMYHQDLGRFLQTDPIGYGDGMNLYAYVGADPINATDSSGLGKEGLPNPHVRRIDPRPGIGSLISGRSCGSCATSSSPGPMGSPGPGRTSGMFSGEALGKWWKDEYSDGTISLRWEASSGHASFDGPHFYRSFEFACASGPNCTEQRVFNFWRSVSAPGAPSAEDGCHDRTLTLGNPISQCVNPRSLTIVNETRPGHTFHRGEVSIQVMTRDGLVGALITGTGSGKWPNFNEWIGRIIFGSAGYQVKSFFDLITPGRIPRSPRY